MGVEKFKGKNKSKLLKGLTCLCAFIISGFTPWDQNKSLHPKTDKMQLPVQSALAVAERRLVMQELS